MQAHLQDMFSTHRDDLSRWFIKLTSDPQTADDLVQETLVEAWKNQHKITDPSGIVPWINAIAANVYKRWCRRQGREQRHINLIEDMPGAASVEIELERNELVSLLDAALDLLPPDLQALLTARYLEGLPHAALAKSLGTTENVIAVRLHRGKLKLRELIEADQNPEAWQSTRLWCMTCGCRTYESKFNPATGELHVRCAHCSPAPHLTDWSHTELEGRPTLKGVKQLKPALNRLIRAADQYIRPFLSSATIPCENCGTEILLRRETPPDIAPYRDDWQGVYCTCSHCGHTSYIALSGIAFSTAQGQAFWQAHPRLALLPTRPIEYQGRDALVVGWRSIHSEDQLDAIFAQDTYELLMITGETDDHE